jgi:hypothetical protein
MHDAMFMRHELRYLRRCGSYRNRAKDALLLILASLVLVEAEEKRNIFIEECPEILQAVLTSVG